MKNFESPHVPEVNATRLARIRTLRWRAVLFRWHRRVGVLVAVVLIELALTGILLNHTDGFQLKQRIVQNSALLSWYGIEAPEITGFMLGDHWLSQLNNTGLYWDQTPLHCDGLLVGVAQTKTFVVVACSKELLLLSATGDLLERLGRAYQLPEPLTHLGFCGKQLCMQSQAQVFTVNLDTLVWEPIKYESAVWSEPNSLLGNMEQQLTAQYQGAAVSWERVVLDLHSGRLFGGFGVFLKDLSAVLLILLAVSGFWLWWRRPGRR